jgi:hypothetical protein
MLEPDRQDACPTGQSGTDFMVVQSYSLSIRNDGPPRVPPRAERGVATKSFFPPSLSIIPTFYRVPPDGSLPLPSTALKKEL